MPRQRLPAPLAQPPSHDVGFHLGDGGNFVEGPPITVERRDGRRHCVAFRVRGRRRLDPSRDGRGADAAELAANLSKGNASVSKVQGEGDGVRVR
jgi:hypothetical protein